VSPSTSSGCLEGCRARSRHAVEPKPGVPKGPKGWILETSNPLSRALKGAGLKTAKV